MFIKKKLSDEDKKYWVALTKTLDSRNHNHIKNSYLFNTNETNFHTKLDIEGNLFVQKEKVIKKIDEKKYFRDTKLQDIRIDKNKLSLLKRGKLQPEFIALSNKYESRLSRFTIQKGESLEISAITLSVLHQQNSTFFITSSTIGKSLKGNQFCTAADIPPPQILSGEELFFSRIHTFLPLLAR